MDLGWLEKLVQLLDYVDAGTQAAHGVVHGVESVADHARHPLARVTSGLSARRQDKAQRHQVKARRGRLERALKLVDGFHARAVARRDVGSPPGKDPAQLDAPLRKAWLAASDWMRENWSPALDDDLYWACNGRTRASRQGADSTRAQTLFLAPQTWEDFCRMHSFQSLSRDVTTFHNNAKRLIGAYTRFLNSEE